MTTYKMLDEIIYYCSKCKLDLNHRIIRVEEGKPKRLLCFTCKTERNYRRSDPDKVVPEKTRKSRTSPSKSEQNEKWLAKLERPVSMPKVYAMSHAYDLNDYVEHTVFGVGLVVSVTPPDKMSVFFKDGLKTMKCGAVK
ncbi:MAG: hypothetical protein U1F57_12305 [bacterium]